MVEVIVQFPSSLGTGIDEEKVTLQRRTVKGLLEKLLEIHGDELRAELFGQDAYDLNRDINIFVEGINIENGGGGETKLSDGSKVTILPVVAGGGKDEEKFFGFDEDQIRRYSRQIVLPEVGGRGQKKLLDSSVLIVGAGALGSPAALYLAGAGVGSIGIVDDDVVKLSNLQRQILHGTGDLKDRKVESARRRFRDVNPEVEVLTYDERLEVDNVYDVLDEGWDAVLDASDNFPTKFLLNDVCVIRGIPLSHAGILRFTGMVTTILPEEGPCYRCFTPEAPPPGMVPSCQEAGVLGAVPGIIGSIQAIEVLKFLLGVGELLVGRLLLLEASKMSFDEVRFTRRKDCLICSEEPKIKDIRQVDYGDVCQVRF